MDYGFARGQIEMLNGHLLHEKGHTGTGIRIAVIDAGYEGFLQSPAFDSLRNSPRLLGTFNYLTNDTNVFSGWGSHGTSVLSIMAANLPDTLVGTAYDAYRANLNLKEGSWILQLAGDINGVYKF